MPIKYSNLAVIYGNYKLVAKNLDHLAQSSGMELFHLKSDPRELNNLVAKYPDTAHALKKLLDNWFDEVTQTPALLNQPIVLGNEPIRLSRLDWKGPVGRQWSRKDKDVCGFYDVEVPADALYEITFKFLNPLPRAGGLSVDFGSKRYFRPTTDTTQTDFVLKDITLNKGRYPLWLYFESWNEFYGVQEATVVLKQKL